MNKQTFFFSSFFKNSSENHKQLSKFDFLAPYSFLLLLWLRACRAAAGFFYEQADCVLSP